MCAGCAMVAVASASGLRSWLAAHHLGWLPPVRMRRVTLVLCALALLVPSAGLSGSTKPSRQPVRAAVVR